MQTNGLFNKRRELSQEETKLLRWDFRDVYGYYPHENDRKFKEFVYKETGMFPYKKSISEKVNYKYPFMSLGKKKGKGWHGETQRHAKAAKKGWQKRRNR